MIKLIQVELRKIFKRKSIYVIWILMLIFCVLNNILYYKDYDEDGNYKYLEQENLENEIQELEDELDKYDKKDLAEVTMYITIKTKLDILELKQRFLENSWQYKKINTYLYDVIYQINYYQYVEENKGELIKFQNQYEIILNNLNNGDYSYFLNIEIQNNVDDKKYLEEVYKLELDEKNKQEIQKQIDEIGLNLKILNFRLKNNIREDNSYLNIALENYLENYNTVKYYENIKEKKHQDKINYQEALSNTKISEYIINHRENINKQNNLNYQLRTIIEDYEVFIVMLVLIVCSTIICDEFKDGTIKLLLIKPYSRCKILLSKYLTTIIVVIITILFLIVTQLIIGGIIFGLDSLKIPVVVYDFNKSIIVEYSVFHYMLIRIVARIPFLFILIVICFFVSVITNSVIISITMPLLLYMFSSTMKYLMKNYHLNFMKYLVNINWDLQDCLFGRLHEISYINFGFSIIILLIYFCILLMLTFWIFKRKNIKNI